MPPACSSEVFFSILHPSVDVDFRRICRLLLENILSIFVSACMWSPVYALTRSISQERWLRSLHSR